MLRRGERAGGEESKFERQIFHFFWKRSTPLVRGFFAVRNR